MAGEPGPHSAPNVEALAAAAQRLGVEFDATDARQWLLAVSTADRQERWAQDYASGVFGSQVALADFNPDDLAFFRRLARRARLATWPEVESAIAIAGSSAQSKIQRFPGDVDFFERVHIHAASETEARRTLRGLLRASALRAMAEPDIVLIETNFGAYPQAGQHHGHPHTAGDSILWRPEEVLAGEIELASAEGEAYRLSWDELEAGTGWSYLGWIMADRPTGRLALVGNMLDATWEGPDGRIVALDGALDAFFQEVYLEAEALPVFQKLARQVDPDARQVYAASMRSQVQHYLQAEPSYCKATKRLYNLLRVTDQLEAAAYLRELFDEPRAQLYQVDGLLEAARLACEPSAGIAPELVAGQIDTIRQALTQILVGPDERDLPEVLERLRARVAAGTAAGRDWDTDLDNAQRRCRALVNDYFRERLFDMPLIADYLAAL